MPKHFWGGRNPPRGDKSVLRPSLNWEGGAARNNQNWYNAGSSEIRRGPHRGVTPGKVPEAYGAGHLGGRVGRR